MTPAFTTLKNGLRVITIPMKDTPTVTVLVLVETGSKYETKQQSGLSHFLEHMCFKGTEKRPSTFAISAELDAIGSQYNAFTDREYTGYYAKSAERHFKKIFDVVSDVYLNPLFPVAEIEKEKGVIVEEINMYEDLPQYRVHDLFGELLFGDQPVGRSVLGTKASVTSMTQKDFVEYHRSHYVPQATTIVVSGKIHQAAVIKEIKRTFEKLPKKKKATKEKVTEKQKAPAIAIKHKETDQTHLVLGFRSYDVYDKRNHILSVMATILSGGFSSRLFMRLREELGVAYYVRAENHAFTDHGDFTISTGVTNDRSVEIIQEVLTECKRLITEDVSQEELSKAKEYMIGNMKLELESSDAWAMYYGGQHILRKSPRTPEQVEAKIRSVSAKQIKAVAAQVFKNEGLNLALIGPHADKKVFEKILRL